MKNQLDMEWYSEHKNEIAHMIESGQYYRLPD